jgi:hypothetical protein
MLGPASPSKGAFSASRFEPSMRRRTTQYISGHSLSGGQRGAPQSRRAVRPPSALALANPPMRAPWRVREGHVPEPDGDEWFHVVERPRVRVFVHGACAPCLVVKELNDRARGSVGLWVGEGSDGHYANLRVTRTR